MTQVDEPVHGIAPLENVARCAALIDRLQHRAVGLPGLGCLYGEAGHGKTSAAIHAVNAYNACHVECLPVGGVKGLMEMIVRELGLRPARTTEGLFTQAAERLTRTQQPLIVDEVDQVLSDRAIELIRRLHDVSQAPVILMGEELLPQKLRRWPRVSSRVLNWVGVQPATARDVDHLAKIYASGVNLAPDLKAAVLRASRGSLRDVSTNLAGVKEEAGKLGLTTVDLATWGDRPFHTGEPPAPRNLASLPAIRRRRIA